MNFSKIKNGMRIISKFASQHSPTILTVIGVGLMIGGVAITIVEAPKAKSDLDILEEDDELTHKEYVKEKARVIAQHYWKTATMTLGGAGIIFWGHKISLGRTAAALAAYQMSKDDLEKLKDKIVETDGEKHLNKLEEAITKDEVKRNPFNSATVINTGHGNTLFYDPIGRDYFLSDLEFIRQMRDEANLDMAKTQRSCRKASLSYDGWREYIGLPALDGIVDGKKLGPAIGKDLGWLNRNIELKITCTMLPDDTVCHIMGFTKYGGPEWYANIGDEDRAEYEGDD